MHRRTRNFVEQCGSDVRNREPPHEVEAVFGAKGDVERIELGVLYEQVTKDFTRMLVRCGHQFRRVVERPRCAQRQDVPVFAARVGMLAARADLFHQFAIEGVNQSDVVVLIGGVNHIVDDLEAVRALEYTRSPGTHEFSLWVEDQHCRVFALEHIKPVLRIGFFYNPVV